MSRRATTAAERRRAARALRRRHAVWAAVFAAGFGAGALLGPPLVAPLAGLCFPESVRLRELSVTGNRRVEARELLAAAGLEPDTRLDRLETAELARRLEAHPWIREARVAALSPGRLSVAIEEREPVATARLEAADGAAWWVDASGVAFAPVEDPAEGAGLPRIVGVEDAAPEHPDPRLAQAVGVGDAARARGVEGLEEVHVGGGDPHALPSLRLARPRAEVLLGGGALEAKLERLARLLAAELPEVLAASAIDLRFGERTFLRSDASRTGDAEATARGSASASGNGPAG